MSSSHIWLIQDFGGEPHDLGDSFAWEAAVGVLNLAGTHSLGQARKDERSGEPRAADGEPASQQLWVGADPTEILVGLELSLASPTTPVAQGSIRGTAKSRHSTRTLGY